MLDQLRQAEPDLLRSMLTAFVQALMSADADVQSYQIVALLATAGDGRPHAGQNLRSRQNWKCEHVRVRGIEELDMRRDAEPALMRLRG